MRQKLLASKNAIPENTWFTEQINNAWKQLLEWVELFYQIEELAGNLKLEKDSDLDIPVSWLVGYYVLLDWKKVWHFSSREVIWMIKLVSFAVSNAKNDIEIINEEDGFLYEIIEKLDNTSKIPFLWIATLLKFIYFVNSKWNKEFFFTASKYSIEKQFYTKSLELFKQQGIIKDWEYNEREYKVTLTN